MYIRRFAVVVGMLGLGIALTTATVGRTQQDPAPPPPPVAGDQQQDQTEGTEVLARGPIHEAFADPVNNKPQPTDIVPKEPPPAIEELPPDQKPAGENVQWFAGYWSWDDDRNDFIWVSGMWRVPPPGRNWVPGHWNKVAAGYQRSPGFWMVVQEETDNQNTDAVQYLPPPPEPIAAAASIPAPNDQSVFVPGVWVYRDTRYLWRPGFWVEYRPGWVWIPAHYVWTPVGYVFVEGYWDLELSRRGLVFAPVYFHRPLWTVASWFFQPRYLVYDDFIRGALFVRPGAYSYYFGDYFEPAYRRRGFVAFIDFRIGNFGYDPLFSYYRWSNRGDRRAVADLRELYASRFSGRAPRPPATLAQQNTVIQNITNNNVTNVTNITNVTALAPLNNVNRNAVKLQPVPRAQQLQEQKLAQNLRQASVNRAQMESRLLASNSVATTANAKPVAMKLDMPRPRVPNNIATGIKPPPSPSVAHPTTRPSTEVTRPSGTPGRPVTQPGTPSTRPSTEPMPKPQPKVEPRPEPKPKVEPRKEPPKPPSRPPSPPKKSDKSGDHNG